MAKRDKRERHRDDDESRRRKKKKKKEQRKQEKRDRKKAERSSSKQRPDEALTQVGPEQIKSACDILVSLLELYPDARGELLSLFQILDEGESVAVDCIEDVMVKESVVLLLDLLRLKSEVSEFGKAYSKTATTIGLVESFSDILGPVAPDSDAAHNLERGNTSTQRVIGPTLPTQADHALAVAQQDSDSDDVDELVGPLLPALAPPISEEELERRRIDREKEWKRVMASDGASEKTAGPGGREEWMTALPTHRTGISAAAGLQARTFMADGIAEIGDTSQWTDSAEDKQRKLEARLREKEISQQRREAGVGVARRPAHAASARKVEQVSRGPSLLEQHRQAMSSFRAAANEPEPHRVWDRDRDMTQGSVDTKALREVVQKAKQLGSKFSHATL